MNAKQTLYDFQMERFRVFQAKDPENGYFDVVFEIDGKKLYANKFMICLISPTFESMFSERWTKPNEPIPIQNYSFNDFKEFLTFIYSGKCQFTADNITSMVDIAEFYGIKALKHACEEFLSTIELNLTNIIQMIEIANKYSMIQFKEFVYKWAETRATEKCKIDQKLNLNEAIKEKLSDILPLINLRRMKAVFLINVVSPKSFLFSCNKLNEAIAAKKVVEITDISGRIMKGYLECDEEVIKVIQSQNSVLSCFIGTGYHYWEIGERKPYKRSKLIKNDETEWYLIFDREGDLAFKHRDQLDKFDDYLLAEMVADKNFELEEQCKINVC
uniref:BTB domain-containing protein n=1 Tax=Panagrolaimus sp. ES5 TaxID=591445 RepID=A0AC34F0V7_9BILA